MYEASARVPMILTGPGISPGTVVHKLASLFDVYPTVLDVLGLEVAAAAGKLAGASVLPLAQKRPTTDRKDYIVVEYHCEPRPSSRTLFAPALATFGPN